jgi:hypothetical protein
MLKLALGCLLLGACLCMDTSAVHMMRLLAQCLAVLAGTGSHSEVGVLVEDLCLPAQAGAAHKGTLWQVGQAGSCWRDERVPHILPWQIAWQYCPLRQVGGHILQNWQLVEHRHM